MSWNRFGCWRGGGVDLVLDPEWFREDWQGLLKLAAERRLRPIVAERLPLAEAARAHRMLEEDAVLGKLVRLPQASSLEEHRSLKKRRRRGGLVGCQNCGWRQLKRSARAWKPRTGWRVQPKI